MSDEKADLLIAAVNGLTAQLALSHATVGADALQVVTVVAPLLAPLLYLLAFVVGWVLWRPAFMILKHSGVIPRLRK